jgi:hypothetical protein
MKRRMIKKEIRGLANELIAPAREHAAASPRVHKDVLYGYERQLEDGIFRLMRLYLILDHSWPHRARWLDAFDADFTWERSGSGLNGRGGLWWGRWPEVGETMTRMPFSVEIQVCERHGVDYKFGCGEAPDVRSFSSRKWCEGGRWV